MAELVFFSGTMSSGKSTQALQTHYNHTIKHHKGLLFTTNDRSGQPLITSRLGLASPAINLSPNDNIYTIVENEIQNHNQVDYIICDETQFYTPQQVEQLADIVDLLGINVYAFGLSTDFRTLFFPGTKRLAELADEIIPPAVPALCWCGAKATHQARLVNGAMTMEGARVVVGDIADTAEATDIVTYETLCRKHHRQHITSKEQYESMTKTSQNGN